MGETRRVLPSIPPNATRRPLKAVSPLIHIHEVRVLSIRHIIKRSRIQHELMLVPTVSECLAHFLLLLVLPNECIAEDEEQQELDDIRHQQGADAQMVSRRLIRFVEERADDVADASSEPDHAGDDHLLGLTSDIGRDQRQTDHEGGLV